jgi:hypothetical protein
LRNRENAQRTDQALRLGNFSPEVRGAKTLGKYLVDCQHLKDGWVETV